MKYDKIPFCNSELESEETLSQVLPFFARLKKPVYPIDPLENFKRSMEGEPVWLASDSDFTMFAPSVIVENVARGMVVEEGDYPEEEYGGKDFFGLDWQYEAAVGGSMVKPGEELFDDASEWKDHVVFPDLSALDWEGSVQKNKNFLNQGRPIRTVLYTGYFERLISFMGMQDALVAMIDEDQQEDVKELFDRLTDFYIELIGYMKKYFNIKMLWFHDDWGSQKAPLFSYDTIEDMVFPYLKRLVDACHELDILFEMHSCGRMDNLVELMYQAGVDVADIQNMDDKSMLTEKYAGKMGIEIEVNLDTDLTAEELRNYVSELLDTYRPGFFLGKTFKNVSKLYEISYEESRKRYSLAFPEL